MSQITLVRISSATAAEPTLVQRMRRSRLLMALLSPAVILLTWECLVQVHILDQRFFPAPSSIIVEMIALIRSGEVFVNAAWTIERVLVGFALGAIPGVVIGVLLGLSPTARDFLQPAISSFYPVPKIALFPLIMMIFGIGEPSKWAIVAVAVFFQVFYSTLAGVINIERIYLDVASNFKATRWQTWKTIAFPGALPFIFTGCHLGIGMALIMVVIAENFGTEVGLGYRIWQSWQVFEVRDMFVYLLVVSLLGYGSQLFILYLQRAVLPWKQDNAA